MLIAFIYWTLYVLIMSLVEKKYKNKMKEGVNVDFAIRIRKKVRAMRIFFAVFSIPVIVFLQYCLNEESELDKLFNSISIPIAFYIVFLRSKKKKSPFASFSFLSFCDVIESQKDFILFLRGFESDDYSTKNKLKGMKKYKNFSEYHFFKSLKKTIELPIYAVGMTKELETPVGATRVYLEDYSWKQNVKELIEKASLIIIEINDRESCMWEIEMCDDYLKKTIFLITHKEKYLNVYNFFKNKHCFLKHRLPDPNSFNDLICFSCNLGKLNQQIGFKNDKESYLELATFICYNQNYNLPVHNYSMNWRKVLGISLIVLGGVIGIFIYMTNLPPNNLILILLLCSILAGLFIYVWAEKKQSLY